MTVGRQEIAQRYRDIFASTDLSLKSRVDAVRVAGDWAVARGAISGEATSKLDGTTRQVNDKLLMLLEMRGEAWLIAELMWNASSVRESP